MASELLRLHQRAVPAMAMVALCSAACCADDVDRIDYLHDCILFTGPPVASSRVSPQKKQFRDCSATVSGPGAQSLFFVQRPLIESHGQTPRRGRLQENGSC
jgi:hypothetical protein